MSGPDIRGLPFNKTTHDTTVTTKKASLKNYWGRGAPQAGEEWERTLDSYELQCGSERRQVALVKSGTSPQKHLQGDASLQYVGRSKRISLRSIKSE